MALFLVGCTTPSKIAGKPAETTSTQALAVEGGNGTVTLRVEIADTPEEHTLGYMYRENIPEGTGMFFIFPDEEPRSFYMKNTLVPLDMIFADKDFTIRTIVEDAEPCKADPCIHYHSIYPAMYVLEVPAGFAKEHSLQAGDRITYPS